MFVGNHLPKTFFSVSCSGVSSRYTLSSAAVDPILRDHVFCWLVGGMAQTLQALGVMGCFREDWPLLIVAPASMRLM